MIKTRIGRAILAMVPSVVLLFAYATGPEPRHTTAPGDNPLGCTAAGCHNTFALNTGTGNVRIEFPDGETYTPGVAKTLRIVITEATARAYGFQLTARLESDLANGQAGDFTPGVQQVVICEDGSVKRTGCPANRPVQFIEHADPFRTNTINVSWTPPATNAGNVRLYIAANAANADGNNTGDRIYTANYLLTPQAAGAPPSITKVVSASAFNADAGLASGTWLEIYGENFGTTPPTVTINNLPAFIAFNNATQINVQAPDDSTVGSSVPIQVTAGGARSNTVTMEKKAIAPALLAPEAFKVDGRQYVVAQYADQTFVGRTGLIAGVAFRPAKPGEVVTIYGIGFGPVSPPSPSGTPAAGLTAIQPTPVLRIGNTTATLQYAGLTPGLIGLYQFNVVIPTLAPGDYALTVDTGGVAANSGLFITLGQ
jgi:uncharacterized protein (TIGR03437 family)